MRKKNPYLPWPKGERYAPEPERFYKSKQGDWFYTSEDGLIYERAELGVDGDCGFALLGPNIQEGECEFVKVDRREGECLVYAERRAAHHAHYNLKKRIGWMSYFTGDSYP